MSILDRFTHTLRTFASSIQAPRVASPVRALTLTKSYYSTAQRPGRARLGITGTGADWRVIRTLTMFGDY